MNFVKQLFASIRTFFKSTTESSQPQHLFSAETNPEESIDNSVDNDKGRSLTKAPSVTSVKILPTPNG